MTVWTGFLLAGQRPGPDPMATAFGAQYKALVKVAGRAMLARSIDNVTAVDEIETLFVLAQEPDALLQDADVADVVAAVSENGCVDIKTAVSSGGIATSIIALAEQVNHWPIFITTADHPLLQPQTIAAFLEGSAGCDVAVGMVERQTVEQRFPNNRRTWLRFKGGSWTGANLFAIHNANGLEALKLWAEIEQHRKKGWRLIARFGPWLLLRALTRTISLTRALEKAGRRIGVNVKLVPMDDPLAAVDVDKPSDHELAETLLKEKQ